MKFISLTTEKVVIELKNVPHVDESINTHLKIVKLIPKVKNPIFLDYTIVRGNNIPLHRTRDTMYLDTMLVEEAPRVKPKNKVAVPDQMAESVVSFLLNNLSTLIREEHQLLGSLGENVEFVWDEMSHMKAFLRVADAKEEVDPQLKEWANQVREVAYDAQDVMDLFMLRFVAQPMEDGFLGWIKQRYMSLKTLKARHQIVSRMKKIQFRVKNISEGHLRYKDIYGTLNQDFAHVGNTWYDGRGHALLLEEAEVVGIEKPKRQLVEWLSPASDSRLKVISVVGTGGLGKTTLVKKVYDDAVVKMAFSTHVWITISPSDSFKLEEILRSMIRKMVIEVKQPLPQGFDAMDVDEMKEFVYTFLQNRSFIIVLDDIWTINAWEAIRYAFPRSITCGCIIITTRFRSIGQAAVSIESSSHVYHLEPLPQEDSWNLFCRRAFLGRSCPDYLEEIARTVLIKCEGLPLAIVVISSLLATKKNNIEEWKKVHRSLNDEIEGNHLKRLTKLLSLSFYDLPYYLKSCFMYFSIFPKDQVVYRNRLIRLWTAEGFIQPSECKTVEEVAKDYLEDLIDRGLIQVVESTSPDVPKKLHVHDILLSIISSKSKEQNFVTTTSGGDINCADKCRRLAIHGSIRNMKEIKRVDRLQSVVVRDFLPLTEHDLSQLLRKSSKQLKVLELRGVMLENIPNEVFKLYLLKYLCLKYTKIKYVPKSIKVLQNLETLDLRDTNVKELPVEILQLRRLRHLLVYSYQFRRGHRPVENVHSFKAPYRIGCFQSLQTLYDIEATQAADTTIVKEIGKLIQLKKLGVMKLKNEDGKDLCFSLTNLYSLRSLYIAASKENEIIDLQYPMSLVPPLEVLDLRGRLLKVPDWIFSLNALNRLWLRWSKLSDDPLESLQYLPSLLELELYHAYEGTELCFNAKGFWKLEKLLLLSLKGLRSVRIEDGSMPLLQKLNMWDCKLMEELPKGIEHLHNLQYIDFSDMSDGFVEKLEKQKKAAGNNWNLARIPKIEIYSLISGEWEQRRL